MPLPSEHYINLSIHNLNLLHDTLATANQHHMSSPAPRNRKERRADARQKGEKFQPLPHIPSASNTNIDIPLSQPDRSGPKTKTLFELADERNALLAQGQPFSPVHGDGLARDEHGRVLLPARDSPYSPSTSPPSAKSNGSTSDPAGTASNDDSPIGPLGEALFLSVTLAMLHFTLTLLVHNQYASAPPTLAPLAKETLLAAPWLFVVVYLMKLPAITRWATVKQAVHFVAGTGAGCYLLYVGNRESYLAVMKRAPPVGAVWIWSVIEMRLIWAVISTGVCAGWLWWKGFSIL